MTVLPPKKHIVIATRGSKLALWQADYLTAIFAKQGVTAEKLVLKTTADRIQDRFLHEIGGKGLFVKELEEALLQGKADVAIHSLKDMPAVVKEPFYLAAILARHKPTDLFIMRSDLGTRLDDRPDEITPHDLAMLGPIKVGTGSLRRQAILSGFAPNVTSVGVRGNVDTRLEKLERGEFDALILAEASVERLNIQGLKARRLAPSWFIPCAGQGALALETLAESPLNSWLKSLECQITRKEVTAERLVLSKLGGDCTMPIGVAVRHQRNAWHASAGLYGRSGTMALVEHEFSGGSSEEDIALRLVEKLYEQGAKDILTELGIQS